MYHLVHQERRFFVENMVMTERHIDGATPKENEPQETMGFLGPVGTFTQEAAILLQSKQTGREIRLQEYGSISELFDAVSQGIIDSAVVPIVNTTDGHIGDSMSGFLKYEDIRISGEETSAIKLYYFHRPETDLNGKIKVASKDTALRQCSKNRGALFPNSEEEMAVASTALGVKMAAGDPSLVGIGSERAGELLGFSSDVLIRSGYSIEDNPNNATTFVVITKFKEKKPITDRDKTSFIIDVPHEPGGLIAILNELSDRRINLNKIKSLSQTDGKISFFMSIDGHEDEESIREALNSLEDMTSLRRLGSYAKSDYQPEIPPLEPDIQRAADRIRKEVENGDGRHEGEKVIIFTLHDRPGALRDAILPFAKAGINLTRIDSQPSGNYDEIIFYLAYGAEAIENENQILQEVKNSCQEVYILNGSEAVKLAT